jgi:hypothetical protein
MIYDQYFNISSINLVGHQHAVRNVRVGVVGVVESGPVLLFLC